MSKLKKVLLMCTAYVLVAALAIGGTLAYLQDDDSAVNVMTLGNVYIEQIEQERDENGNLVPFTQAKPALPAVYEGSSIPWADASKWPVAYDPAWKVVEDNVNVVDKFVSVKNTGKSDAFVRTIIAFEAGKDKIGEPYMHLVHNDSADTWDFEWAVDENNKDITIEIDGSVYYIGVYTYIEALKPGATTVPNVKQIYLDKTATNEVCASYGETFEIIALSQAVQTAGFADAKTALNTGFGIANTENVAKWFGGIEFPVVGTQVSAENISNIDFTAENTTFVFNGQFEAVAISELGEGSEIYFNNATVGNMKISDDAVIKGTATLDSLSVVRNSVEPIVLTIAEGDLDIAGELSVKNTDGKSVLNIENSNVNFGTIFVGEHTNNHSDALAELNVNKSIISGEENGLGSTVAVWGRSGVKATIYDSEIYTYSRGWHQSEDANDNAITVQGATNLELDIQRSNMHLYGARSIVNLRQYGNETTTKTANIEESLIWVVTKSSHGETTLPVWGVDESNIKNSILLFTKNVHQSTPAVFKSFVYGNPVIHGNYHVTTQCQWDAPIALADGQTVTFASDANVSVYEGAGNVEFVKNGTAKVVVENGAVVENINGIN